MTLRSVESKEGALGIGHSRARGWNGSIGGTTAWLVTVEIGQWGLCGSGCGVSRAVACKPIEGQVRGIRLIQRRGLCSAISDGRDPITGCDAMACHAHGAPAVSGYSAYCLAAWFPVLPVTLSRRHAYQLKFRSLNTLN